jgi:two component regulator with propeller domain
MRVAALAMAAVPACSAGPSALHGMPAVPPPAPPPSVIAMSETRPVTALAAAGNQLFVGTPGGLVVWQVNRGTFERWGAEYGLPNPRIRALATDDRGGVWVLSDAGLHLYNEDHFVGFDNPPAELSRASLIVAAQDGRTAWIGGHGVLRVRDGAFADLLPGARVTAMARDADGLGVWVGTEKEGAYRFAVDRFLNFGKDWGLTLSRVDSIALTRRGDPVFGGQGPDGARLAYFDGRRFWVYRVAASELRVLGPKGKQQVHVACDRRLFALAIGREQPGDGPEVVPIEKGAPPLQLLAEKGEVPYAPTAVLVDGANVYFGTEALGVLRPAGEALRTRDARGDRDRLAVGCDAKACYFVGGGGVYRLRAGARSVEPLDLGADRMLWVGNDPGGDLAALRASQGRSAIQLCLFEDGRFVPRRVPELKVSKGEPYVSFARYAPSGDLWVGLLHRDDDGELRNEGVAVQKASGEVAYYRASAQKKKGRTAGGLPLPDEVRGVAFGGDATWLATLGGLVRIQGGQASWLSRDEAPVGDICSDVAIDGMGTLWAASPDGLCRFQDGKWETVQHQGPLERGASALAVDAQGKLWVGTQGGVYRWDGSAGDRVEGTVGDGVLDLEFDRQGRLWVLTMDGYSVHPR